MNDETRLRLIRIFLSSPGDVTNERTLAQQVLEQLPYHPLLRGKIALDVVAWDKPGAGTAMLASMTPQEAINQGLPQPSECDIMVVIFWSRMGTLLPEEYVKPEAYRFPTGTRWPDWRYLSGTEWEYVDAMQATPQPLVVVYRRTEKVLLDPAGADFASKLEQWQHVEAFFKSFTNADGSIRQGYNSYATPDDFRSQFETHLYGLVKRLMDSGTTITPPSHKPEPPLWKGSPFPGLRAFTPADAPIFFGRGRETDELIRRVSESRFVAVVGASGSGKSSLVGAGLIPRLKDNAISGEHLGSKDWRIVSFKPGEKDGDPFRALTDALLMIFPALIDRPLEAKQIKDDFVAALKADPASLMHTVAAALAHDPAWAEVLLFVDQFEELFTVVQPDLRAPFVDLLNSVAHAARLRTVVTMRADFYHASLQYKALEELLRAGSFPLGAPGPLALAEMITRPAERAGLQWEDDYLPERILQDTGSEPGSLALMAYTLDELYRACTDGDNGLLSHAAYERLGGVRGAIGTRAETAFEHLPGDENSKEKMLQRVFLALVEVDERGTATRRRAPKAQLLAIDGAGALIDYFTGPEVRLLVTTGDDDHADVEVAHEALLRNWDRLTQWIDTAQDDLRLLRQVEREATDWDTGGRSYLLTVERLKSIHRAIERLDYIPNTVIQDFIYPQKILLAELERPETTEQRRRRIGDDLAELGDPREGIGVINGVPDMVWLAVDGSKEWYHFEFGDFEVKPFYIAKFLVTFPQYQSFVTAEDGHKNPDWWRDMPEEYQCQPLREQLTETLNSPRDRLSWYQSVAFARWLNHRLSGLALLQPMVEITARTPSSTVESVDSLWVIGKNAEIRLPTEWEWQWAAQNGTEAREFPWGEMKRGYANTRESGTGLERASAVGMYPHGSAACGALDMSGNMWEWCLNKNNLPEQVVVDASDDKRVVRGGSFYFDLSVATCAYRYADRPRYDPGNYGVRLVIAESSQGDHIL